MADGVFVATERLLERIAAAVPPKAELEALVRVLRSVRAAGDATAARAAVEEAAPSLAPYLTDYWGLDAKQWADVLPFLLFALGYILAAFGLGAAADVAKAAAGAAQATRAFSRRDKSPEDLRDAAELGAKAALEERDARRREKNERKRERKERR